MTANGFKGFPRGTVEFLAELARNNNKEWFDEHRQDYEVDYLEPAREFVVHMGEALRKIAPGLHAEPAVNKSIFRINRDVRFSKDKSPYKAHLGIFLWEGARPRMECPGFYFHLEPPTLMLGHGIYMFPPPLLEAYRRRVAQPEHGRALVEALRQIGSSRDYNFGSEQYKRVPSGYDPEYEYADLLRYKGLTAGVEGPIPDVIYTPEFIDYCLERYTHMAPLHRWLLGLVE